MYSPRSRPGVFPSPLRKRTFVLTLAVSSAIVACLLAELAVRLFFGHYTPADLKAASLPYEPTVFARHAFPRRQARAEGPGGVTYLINSQGYRGPEFSSEKSSGTIRIMIYGGSSVFDIYMPEGADWPRRVEAELQQRGFSDVQVINAGVPLHASFDSLGRFFSEGHLLKPDYVALYAAWNDIKFFRSDEPLLRLLTPYQGNPLVDYQGSLDRHLSEISQLYVRLRQRYYRQRIRFGEEGRLPEGQITSHLSPRALAQFRLTVETFVDVARNAGSTPVLISEARLVTRTNSEAEMRRIRYELPLLTHDALCEAYERTDEVLRRVAGGSGAAFIDASRELSGKDDLFYDHVHLTQKGSAELASLVAREMEPLLRARKRVLSPLSGREKFESGGTVAVDAPAPRPSGTRQCGR